MAISAESITKSSTLEQLRTQFNNLVSDLTALEAGKAAFTEISTTTITGTAINVAEDGTSVFEGATNDDFGFVRELEHWERRFQSFHSRSGVEKSLEIGQNVRIGGATFKFVLNEVSASSLKKRW